MNDNCPNIGREEDSLNITNTNLLNRFNKTREIFPSVTRVLSFLLTTVATSVNVERLKSVYQTFHVRFQLPAMRRCELSAAITQLMSVCEAGGSGRKDIRR